MLTSARGLAGFTTSAMPSRATLLSTGTTPASKPFCFSTGVTSRDALAMSQVPPSSAEIPTPEPPPVTAMVLPAFAAMKDSAQCAESVTMVSEPLTVTVSCLPAASAANEAANTRAVVAMNVIRMDFLPVAPAAGSDRR